MHPLFIYFLTFEHWVALNFYMEFMEFMMHLRGYLILPKAPGKARYKTMSQKWLPIGYPLKSRSQWMDCKLGG